jgi:hypothetical protein
MWWVIFAWLACRWRRTYKVWLVRHCVESQSYKLISIIFISKMKHLNSTGFLRAILCLTFCFAIAAYAAPLEKRDASSAIAEIVDLLDSVALGVIVS